MYVLEMTRVAKFKKTTMEGVAPRAVPVPLREDTIMRGLYKLRNTENNMLQSST